ncbi:MAG: patatin-like phospholipase family protein [Proteobacteria bacterium]|nr:patatin-like phospholipase family protein [Pseudomonadota bacterium]
MKKILFFILLAMIILMSREEVFSSSQPQGKEIDLVLSGSGTRHPAYVGAIRALLENGYQIKRVAGVSGGGLVACSLSYGIINAQDPPETILKRITSKIDRKEKQGFIERWKRRYNLIKHLGFYSGDEFEAFLDSSFEGKMMSDLKMPTKVYGTDIWNQKVIVFTNSDHLKISRVLRMTTSVPILFTPVKYNGGLIVDGGIGGSFPIDAFKDGVRPIIGIQLKAPNILPKSVTSPEELSLFQYVKLILLTLFTALENEHMKQVPPPGAKVIALDTGNFSRIDPDINDKERIDLYQSGYLQMKEKLREIDAYLKDFYSRREKK